MGNFESMPRTIVTFVAAVILGGVVWAALGRGYLASIGIAALLGLFRLVPALRRLRRP